MRFSNQISSNNNNKVLKSLKRNLTINYTMSRVMIYMKFQ